MSEENNENVLETNENILETNENMLKENEEDFLKDYLSKDTKSILIIILNLSLSILLCITISKTNPNLLLFLLTIILGNIMYNDLDNNSDRFKIIFIGLSIYLSLFIIDLKRNEFMFDKLESTLWKFVFITILIRYLIKIEI